MSAADVNYFAITSKEFPHASSRDSQPSGQLLFVNRVEMVRAVLSPIGGRAPLRGSSASTRVLSMEIPMRVQDVMTRKIRTVVATASAEQAWELMKRANIHHLVVTTTSGVLGVLSERDAGGRRGAAVRTNRAVAELMTTPAVTVEPTTTVRRAANMMRGRAIGCLVVVKAGQPIGIVTVSDLLELLGRGMDRGAVTRTRPTLKHRVPHRKGRTATGAW